MTETTDTLDSQTMFDRADEFTRAYIVTALWTGVEPLEDDPRAGRDKDYDCTPGEIAPETMAEMIADCHRFQLEFATIIEVADATGLCKRGPDCDSALARAGHDFWLTRNGHGAGFWDGDWPEPYAAQLDAASRGFGGYDLYIGDDGLAWGMSG